MNESLADTIQPKSDQLNADDLIAGPITVTVETVKRSPSPEQPIDIHISGYRPYRPCKSMRRVLICVWGDIATDWVGKRMTLYRDEKVRYGGVAVGGIRISHLSDIDARRDLMLTTTRSKREIFSVLPLKIEQKKSHEQIDYDAKIKAFNDKKLMREWMIATAQKNGWTNATPAYKSVKATCAERAAEIDAEAKRLAEVRAADDLDAGLGPVEDLGELA